MEKSGGMKWKKTILTVIIYFIGLTVFERSFAQQYAFVPFYQDTFLVVHQLNPNLVADTLELEVEAIRAVINILESLPTASVVAFFEATQEQKKLNDWLLYLLLRQFVDQTFAHHSDNLKELLVYYFLNKLGFRQQLAYENSQLYIYAASEENVFQTPFITIGATKYYNITYVANRSKEEVLTVFLLPNPLLQRDRYFSFYLKAVPALTPKIDTVPIQFTFEGQEWIFSLSVDYNLKSIFEDHPTFDEAIYFQFPFSNTFKNSLAHSLTPVLQKIKKVNQLRFLVALTRNAFKYMEDEKVFGYTKPLPAEVVLMYPFSDCEDRSALFFQLVNELTPQPMVVLAYEDHITIGVHIPQFKGDFVEVYKKSFTYVTLLAPLIRLQ